MAFELIHANTFDLVVTDIWMPGREGLETVRDICQNFPETKVVAISGGGQTGTLDVLSIARTFGAHDTLEKPFPAEKLIDCIATLLEP